MLTNREFHLQTGNLAYKTGFSFTKRESWVTKGILGLLFTKKLAKSVVGIALIVSVAILIVVCVGKIKHIQNKKNIIGTWKNANAEEVFTFQENGGLVVNKDMPELGITCGNALYSISSSNMIFVEQRDNSVNFEIEVDQNELTIFFMGHKYWELTK